MARDLFLGKTRRNWARGSNLPEPTATSTTPNEVTDEVTDKFTQEEMTFVAKLAETKAKAEAGDKLAKRQYAKMPKTVLALKAKAKKGDPQAKRMLAVLEKSGLFNQGQTMTITDSDTLGCDKSLGAFVRDEDRVRGGCESGCGAVIPNSNYRLAIFRQAIRRANGRPSTKDIFLAKSKVDRVIGKAGISLYLPGAKPGRRTV